MPFFIAKGCESFDLKKKNQEVKAICTNGISTIFNYQTWPPCPSPNSMPATTNSYIMTLSMSHKIERDYNAKGEDVKTEKKNGKVDNVITFASNVLMSS